MVLLGDSKRGRGSSTIPVLGTTRTPLSSEPAPQSGEAQQAGREKNDGRGKRNGRLIYRFDVEIEGLHGKVIRIVVKVEIGTIRGVVEEETELIEKKRRWP